MSDEKITSDLDGLPMDVFELAELAGVSQAELEVESLTAGHGMLETGASPCACVCSSLCSCTCCSA